MIYQQGDLPKSLTKVKDKNLRNFIERCIAPKAEDRPSASELQKHPFVEKKELSRLVQRPSLDLGTQQHRRESLSGSSQKPLICSFRDWCDGTHLHSINSILHIHVYPTTSCHFLISCVLYTGAASTTSESAELHEADSHRDSSVKENVSTAGDHEEVRPIPGAAAIPPAVSADVTVAGSSDTHSVHSKHDGEMAVMEEVTPLDASTLQMRLKIDYAQGGTEGKRHHSQVPAVLSTMPSFSINHREAEVVMCTEHKKRTCYAYSLISLAVL